jgi:hypothetical protein
LLYSRQLTESSLSPAEEELIPVAPTDHVELRRFPSRSELRLVSAKSMNQPKRASPISKEIETRPLKINALRVGPPLAMRRATQLRMQIAAADGGRHA